MNTLISMLLAIMSNVYTDNTSREIIRQILLSYDQFENLKAGELAKKSFCNTSTINRFCKTLGFNSFADFKAFMTSCHKIRKEQILHHMDITDEDVILGNIEHLVQYDFDKKRFIKETAEFNTIIHRSSRAVLIGAVFPESITLHYQEDMIEMGKCMYTMPIAQRLSLPAEDSDTAVILISFTGRLFDYCKDTFYDIIEKYPNTIVMTGEDFSGREIDPAKIVHLPFKGDDEVNNPAFIEIMRYLKYHYYKTYVKRG